MPADSGQALGSSQSNDAALGGFDGDGDLDVAYANKPGNHVWLNDGTGVFTDSSLTIDLLDTFGLATGDLDGDNDLDTTNANDGPNRVWFNA